MNISRNDFIEMIARAAIDLYPKYKILPSMVIAQACKESAFGKSDCGGSYNFFGMKWTTKCGCDYVELSTKEWDKNKQTYITVLAKFRKYKNVSEGIEGYYNFLASYKRYAGIPGIKVSYDACMAIQKAGWATSPTYGESLYKDYVLPLGLTKYDMEAISGKKEVPEVVQNENFITITVQKGDTLWSLARKYLGFGTKWTQIRDYNGLTSTTIKPGQILKIKGGKK